MNRSRKRPAPHRHEPEIQKARFAPRLLLFRNFALIQFAIRNRAQPGAPLSVWRCCAIGAATAARSRFFQRLARPGLALAIAALFSSFLPAGGRFGERRCGVGLASRRAWQEYRSSPARLQASPAASSLYCGCCGCALGEKGLRFGFACGGFAWGVVGAFTSEAGSVF